MRHRPWGALYRQPTAASFHLGLADRKSHAQTVLLCREEWLEKLRQVAGFDARTGILYSHDKRVAACKVCTQGDDARSALTRHGLAGIDQEVDQHRCCWIRSPRIGVRSGLTSILGETSSFDCARSTNFTASEMISATSSTFCSVGLLFSPRQQAACSTVCCCGVCRSSDGKCTLYRTSRRSYLGMKRPHRQSKALTARRMEQSNGSSTFPVRAPRTGRPATGSQRARRNRRCHCSYYRCSPPTTRSST